MKRNELAVSSPVMPADVFRNGGVSYLRIPAPDPTVLRTFYSAVFGWTVREGEDPGFEDGTGHVIGHFMHDLPVSGEAGVIPYVYVDSIDRTLELATSNGAELLTAPYPEGTLWVARIFDPARNVIGVWQNGPRA
jgi:uncharacterized protein